MCSGLISRQPSQRPSLMRRLKERFWLCWAISNSPNHTGTHHQVDRYSCFGIDEGTWPKLLSQYECPIPLLQGEKKNRPPIQWRQVHRDAVDSLHPDRITQTVFRYARPLGVNKDSFSYNPHIQKKPQHIKPPGADASYTPFPIPTPNDAFGYLKKSLTHSKPLKGRCSLLAPQYFHRRITSLGGWWSKSYTFSSCRIDG